MNRKTRSSRVWARASDRCEYCQLPQAGTVTPHQIDHIRSRKLRGSSEEDNLALSCFYCNSFKGPNVAGYDPTDDSLQPLFHPRNDDWHEHFRWRGAILIGLSPVGRTTIEVLRINLAERVQHRRLLMKAGHFP